MDKLDHCGIRGCALSWFKSYLSCRTQYVTYKGNESNRQMIKCGVPQGSILGSLLFLIYINDLCNVCKITIPMLFADDTNLFSSGVDAHYMCFTTKNNKIKPDISLNIDGQVIAEVTSSTFLGVIIDDELNWRDHVSFVCRKVDRGLWVIIKARKVLQQESLISLWYSFIYPYLIYCNHIWGSACKTLIEPLFILQKKALRIITGVHPRSPSEPLFRQLKFLNCENIFKYLVGHLMYRVYHGELSTLQFLFVKNSYIHMHDTRQSGHYHKPVCRTNLGKSSLRYFGD